MANKEGKFFEQLGMLTENAYEAGEVFQRITEGKMETEDGVDAVHAIKKRARASLGKLYERMYKVYKDPAEIEFARGFIGKMYGIIDVIHEVVDRFTLYNMEITPREFSSMVMLVRDALLEMKKVLDYTGDVAANYMKMEARCRKIYVFEERGDEFYREEIRRLFTEKQSGGYGKDAGCGCRRRNTPAKTFCAGIMWYLFYELILDFSYNLCIIKVHGGNAMAVDVRPSSRFDDYFPDYQFGCG